MEVYKKYKRIDYELLGYKGYVLVSTDITDEKKLKNICLQDYLENYLEKEVNILKEGE